MNVYGAPDTESRYVDGFNSVNEEWDETGSSPWLDDSTANYISTNVDEEWHEEFTFADPTGSGTINSVDLYIELNGPSARNDYVVIDIYDGTSWSNVANQDPDADAYQWYNFDVSTELDSWTKITDAKLRVQYQRSGSPSTETIYARRSYLYIDWTVSAEHYYRYPTQSYTFTWSADPDLHAQRTASQLISWSGSASRTLLADRTGSLSFSWVGSAESLINYYRDASQLISWSGSASRELAAERTASQLISWSGSASRTLLADRTGSLSFSWVGSADAWMHYMGTATLDFTFGSSVATDILRVRKATLSILYESSVNIQQAVSRFADLTFTFASVATGELEGVVPAASRGEFLSAGIVAILIGVPIILFGIFALRRRS